MENSSCLRKVGGGVLSLSFVCNWCIRDAIFDVRGGWPYLAVTLQRYTKAVHFSLYCNVNIVLAIVPNNAVA